MGLSASDLREVGFNDREIFLLEKWRLLAPKVEVGGCEKTLIFKDGEGGWTSYSWPSLDYMPVITQQIPLIHERVYTNGFDWIALCGLSGITSAKLTEVSCARCITLRNLAPHDVSFS